LAGGLNTGIAAVNDNKSKQFAADRLLGRDACRFQAFQNIRPEPNSVSDGLHQITVLARSPALSARAQ